MDEKLFDSLPLSEKAEYVQKHATFIETEDFYSFFVRIYLLNQWRYQLFYDFTGLLVSVEFEAEKNAGEELLSSRLASSHDGEKL